MKRASLIGLAAAVVLPLAGGCASAPAAGEAADRSAILEVVNRSAEALTVSVRGRVEGAVGAGERLRVRHLRPGEALLSARWPGRGAEAEPASHTLELAAGVITTWELGDGPWPPALTTLTVDNTGQRDVVVGLDGRRLGRVFAGRERSFVDLPAGEREITAVSDDRKLRLTTTLTLAATGDNRWEPRYQGATLTVLNDSDEPVTLHVDGELRGSIPAGGRWRSTSERPGSRLLRAVSQPSNRPYEGLVSLALDQPTEWRLADAQASIVVANETGEGLSVRVGDLEPTDVAAGQTVTIEEVPAGEVEIDAVGIKSGLKFAARAALTPGQRYHWSPRPIASTLTVDNRTTQTLSLYFGPRPRGEVPPGESRTFRRLPKKPFQAELIDRDATVRRVRLVDPAASPSSTWIVAPIVGSVTIENARPEAVRVFIDARPVGPVAASSSHTFSGVPIGTRLVEAVGGQSRARLASEVAVTEDTSAKVRLEDPTAILEIANQLGEALATTGILETQIRQVAAGETARFRVPAQAATYRVRAGGLAYARSVTPKPSEVVRWEVRAESTTLTVWNRLEESVAVTVDGRSVGLVATGANETFGGLAAGVHELQAVALDSARTITASRSGTASDPIRWTLEVALGQLLVDNTSAERLAVTVDGKPWGQVEARSGRTFGGIWPGTRVVEARGEDSGVRHRFDTRLEPGQTVRVGVRPPLGTLLIDNQADQALSIRVDSEVIGMVPKGSGKTSLTAPAGERTVRIERLEDHSVVTFRVKIVPEHVLHLPVPRGVARLVVVNQTTMPLTLQLGDRVLGRLAPETSAMYEDLDPGRFSLTARDDDGAGTHTELRILRAGETATWVLQAPR